MPETLSLLGEKSNIVDGEKRTRTAECCRSTDEEQDPARAGWGRSITTGTPGSCFGTAGTVHGEYELRGGIWTLQL